MRSNVAKFVHNFLNTDRYHGAARLVNILALLALLIAPMAAIGTSISVLMSEYEAETPEDWFQQVIGVEPRQFANIQHHTSQGIDVSHHFRFTFTDDADIEAIVDAHNLSRSLTVVPLRDSSLPDWYTPETVLPFLSGRKYSTSEGQSEAYSLFVDDKANVAYFEHVHF